MKCFRGINSPFPDRMGWRRRHRAFTLVELLVVILIILIVSAVTLPSIISAVSHRQVSEAARLLQASMVAARDTAVRTGSPTGVRLISDPTISGIDPSTNMVDINLPLAFNRIMPLESAPDYTEGMVSIIKDLPLFSPFPAAMSTYPPAAHLPYVLYASNPVKVLMVEECPIDTSSPVGLANTPTSWFWNVRIGDKIRIADSGHIYTIVGPMVQFNPELFVNDGPAGSPTQLLRTYLPKGFTAGIDFRVEYLFLINGQDDDTPVPDGFIDNGWDGIDNNFNNTIDEPAEWTETETWIGTIGGRLAGVNSTVLSLPPIPPNPPTTGLLNQPYTITRRPIPSSGSRELSLPSNVVIDATTWASTRERSRFPLPAITLGASTAAPTSSQVLNPFSGNVDLMVYPDGAVVPTTIYSSPSSFGLNGSFIHLWLAERSDVVAPAAVSATVPWALPIPSGLTLPAAATGRAELKGESSLMTIFSRTGRMVINTPPRFDDPANPANGTAYNLNLPFLEAQQGVRGANQ
ncbi:prepilin-type N-terminal cleavage/methylation domain-containing protein [Aquisphaera insulae]|uniref:prepilin-type N-terminal cleavage/methylation domain-containing protein n=1 Tax=Aquisphaera insulae TaxID=2712864 RepID=UPI0013EA67FE|nr:prepilin-type N-terminal cleavage/methylation domain-containing protein [Aquisphaera insulae]